jgi:hypothetical protein
MDEICNHVNLKLLGGPIHPGGKDYYCVQCGEQFRAEPIVIGVSFGSMPTPAPKEHGE